MIGKLKHRYIYEIITKESNSLMDKFAYDMELCSDEISELLSIHPLCYCKKSEIYVMDGTI